jgi:hypothetical protein
MSRAIGPILRVGGAAVKKGWKPATVAVASWTATRFGDKVVDEGFDKFKGKASRIADEKHQEVLAQTLCRARGWTYQRFVVDHAERFVVWSDEKRPMAAFPPIQDASTPEVLAARFELAGYVPLDTDLKSPPPT